MSYPSDSDSDLTNNNENYKNKLNRFPLIISEHPFNYSLSFLQKDKYINEFGQLLKIKYPELEEQWIDLKNLSDEDSDKNLCEGFEEIDINFISGTLTIDLHLKSVNILSDVFEKMIDFVNYHKNDYYLDERVKTVTNEFYIFHKTKHIFKNKFLVDLDYSSYVYDEKTKLYSFNKTKSETMESLKKYISVFKKEIESIYEYFDHPLNIKILDSILNNIESDTVLDSILDMIKEKIEFSFNNENKFEIAYQDKVLNLKSGAVVERTHKHHFTTSVNARYLKKYTGVPEYIKSIFGNDKKTLYKIQQLLGSLLTGCAQNKFILFYGGSNKGKLLSILKEILNGFHLDLNHKYNMVKNCDELIEKYNFKERRIVSLDDIDCKTMLKDKSFLKKLLTDRSFNFIGTTNELLLNNLFLNRRLITLNFPYSFVNQPNKDLEQKKNIFDFEINNDFLFTWMVKGAFKFLISYTEDRKLSKPQLEAMKTYDSDDSFSDIDLLSSEEEFFNS